MAGIDLTPAEREALLRVRDEIESADADDILAGDDADFIARSVRRFLAAVPRLAGAAEPDLWWDYDDGELGYPSAEELASGVGLEPGQGIAARVAYTGPERWVASIPEGMEIDDLVETLYDGRIEVFATEAEAVAAIEAAETALRTKLRSEK